jgi:hypothetical protein
MKIEISNEELRVIVWALENSKDLLEKKLPKVLARFRQLELDAQVCEKAGCHNLATEATTWNDAGDGASLCEEHGGCKLNQTPEYTRAQKANYEEYRALSEWNLMGGEQLAKEIAKPDACLRSTSGGQSYTPLVDEGLFIQAINHWQDRGLRICITAAGYFVGETQEDADECVAYTAQQAEILLDENRALRAGETLLLRYVPGPGEVVVPHDLPARFLDATRAHYDGIHGQGAWERHMEESI